jgi:hypothetical protein
MNRRLSEAWQAAVQWFLIGVLVTLLLERLVSR